jgi:hypothetical protein
MDKVFNKMISDNKKDFTSISNIFKRDKRIAYQYKYIFWEIWSQKQGCRLNFKKICEEGGFSIDVLKAAIKQFEENNYIYRAIYSSTVDKSGRTNNKYNYFFSDEGNAREYYLELVEKGLIDERGKYLKRQIDENTTDYLEQIKNKAIKYIELQKLSSIDVIGIIDITEKHIEKNYNEAYIDDLSSMEYIDRQSIKKSAIVQLKEKNIEKFVNNLINKNK